MLDLFRSLSLGTGALLLAVISAILSLWFRKVPNILSKWALAIICPIILSEIVYWLPVFLGANSDEYSA